MKSLRQMNKENNRSAAGLRRSAIVERIRLREEWSELKGITDVPNNTKPLSQSNNIKRNRVVTSDVLCGVVALVEVGAESRALALRAALTALGASVVPSWTALVTHLVWSEGGCRATRAKARALASRLVSPLWVEACAASNRRLNEQAFPAAARASDLPSPRTLRRLLKRAEMENIPLVDLLADNSNDEGKQKAPRLRISSDTDLNTSTDRSADTSHDTSRDSTDVSSHVNTAPRGARHIPVPTSSRPVKSKRKLFTNREDPDVTKASGDDTDDEKTTRPKLMKPVKLTQHERRDLARAERMAKRLVASCKPRETPNVLTQSNLKIRVVLTAMSRSERSIVFNAIKSLNGHIQKRVNRKTTHVLLGSYQKTSPNCSVVPRTNQQACPSDTSVTDKSVISAKSANSKVMIPMCGKECRTVNALEGAARGCRLLYAQWVIDSLVAKEWLHHYGYEVTHLKKIALKARAERTALGHLHAEYAYNVFYGMRVHVTDNAEHKEGVTRLLTLCGAELIQNGVATHNFGRTKHGVPTQNVGRSQNVALTENCGHSITDYDLTVGIGEGEVCSKWVFDSVAAARMRTTRRYINSNVASTTDNIISIQTTER